MFRYAVVFCSGIVLADIMDGVTARHWAIAAALLTLVALFASKRSALASSVATLAGILLLGSVRMAWFSHDGKALHERERIVGEVVVASEPRGGGETVVFEGLLCYNPESPDTAAGEGLYEDSARNVSFPSHGATVRKDLCGERIDVFMPKASAASLSLGDVIRVEGTLRPLQKTEGEGRYDYRRSQQERGVIATMYIAGGKWTEACRWEERKDMFGMWERITMKALLIRQGVVRRICDSGMDMEASAVAAAMTTGYKGGLTQELRQGYSLSGASHILALSGMHLSVIYMLLTFFLRRRNVFTVVLTLSAVWAYVVFTGMPLSVMRAALMLTFWEVIRLADRRQHPLNILGMTLLLMTVANPMTLWNISFQMSFLAVAAIVVYAREIERMAPVRITEWEEGDGVWCRRGKALVRKVWGVCAVCLAAQLGTMPPAAYYFGTVPLLFLITNIIVVPLSAVIVCGTLLLVLLSFLSAAAVVANTVVLPAAAGLLSWVIGWQNALLMALSSLPCSSLSGVRISLLQLYLIYIIILAVTAVAARYREVLNVERESR